MAPNSLRDHRLPVSLCSACRINESADLIEDAVWRVLLDKKIQTRDIGGTSKTSEFIAALLEDIREQQKQ